MDEARDEKMMVWLIVKCTEGQFIKMKDRVVPPWGQ